MNEVLTDQEIRDSYYIMRAMHDGACPSCGLIDKQLKGFKTAMGGLICPRCGFGITFMELRGIEKITRPAMDKRIDSFYGARDRLAALGMEE